MSLVPGSRFPSHPYQGPEYYPPKHMGAMHASVLVYVNSTPAVVVKDLDDYGSLFSVNLAGGSVAGSATSSTNVGYPQGGNYSYGASIAAGATLGSLTFAGSPYSLTFSYVAVFEVNDSTDTAVENVVLGSGGTAGNRIATHTGAAAGAVESASGFLVGYINYSGGSGSYSTYVAENVVATTANCTIMLDTLLIYVEDFIPGPGTVGETW